MSCHYKRNTGSVIKRLAKQSLKHEKRRNIMVVIAIGLSAFLMSMCGSVAFSLSQVRERMADDTYEAVYTSVTERDISALRKRPEIERVGMYYWLGNYEDGTGITASVTCFDEAMLYTGRTQVRLKEGELPAKKNEIAADSRYLEKYASEVSVGDTFSVAFGGEPREFVLTGIVSNIDTKTENYGFIVSEAFTEAASGYEPSKYRAYVHFRDADAISEESLKQLAASIGEELSLDHVVFNSMYFSRNTDISLENIIVLAALAFLILFGGGIVIQSIFRISIHEKIQSYGRLRALGATSKQIARVVRMESRRLAYIGIPAGIALGLISGALLTHGSMAGGLRISETAIVAVLVCAICLLLIRFSVLKPVKLAAGTSPMEAVRDTAYQGPVGSVSGRRHRINPFNLARINFNRDRKKTFSTLLSLTFGGLLLFVSSSLFNSYSPEQNARLAFQDGDFKLYLRDENMSAGELMSAGNPLSDAFKNKVLSIDGVKAVLLTRSSVGGTDFTIDSVAQGGMCDIITEENAALVERNLIRGRMPEQNDEILLAENLDSEKRYLGEPLSIRFDSSGTEFTAKVVGYFDQGELGKGNGELGLDGAQVLIKETLSEVLMPETACLSYTWEIVTEPSKNSVIQTELEALAASVSGIELYTFEEEVEKWQSQWTLMTGSMQGISWLIFLFGIVNLINMTLSSQFSRKKEISMMRSVGLTRKQLYQMLTGEGCFFVVLSLTGMVITGVPVSIMICNRLGRMMYDRPMTYRFPFLQVGCFMLMLLLSELILSTWSVKNMNRQPLIEQLRTTD